MPLPTIPTHLGPGLSAREAAIDALQRFALGLDLNSPDLIRSAFTRDGVLDKSGLSEGLGKNIGADEGVEAIINTTLANIGPMGSSHQLSNFRVQFDEVQTAGQVICHVLAQHYRPDEARDPTKRDYCLFGNLYYADVVKDGDGDDALWKIKRMGMHILWVEGDMSVFQ